MQAKKDNINLLVTTYQRLLGFGSLLRKLLSRAVARIKLTEFGVYGLDIPVFHKD